MNMETFEALWYVQILYLNNESKLLTANVLGQSQLEQ